MGGNTHPWTHPAVMSVGAVFLISTLILLRNEAGADMPVLNLRLVRKTPVWNFLLAGFLLNMINHTVSPIHMSSEIFLLQLIG
jgi:hypothetical protein